MKRYLLLIIMGVLMCLGTLLAQVMPESPHDAEFVRGKPFGKLVPGAGENGFVYAWNDALDTFILSAQAGGGGGGFLDTASTDDTLYWAPDADTVLMFVISGTQIEISSYDQGGGISFVDAVDMNGNIFNMAGGTLLMGGGDIEMGAGDINALQLITGNIFNVEAWIELEGLTVDALEQIIQTKDITGSDKTFIFPNDEMVAGDILVASDVSDLAYLNLANTQIVIGDGSGIPTAASLSKDVTMTNTGAVTIDTTTSTITTYVENAIFDTAAVLRTLIGLLTDDSTSWNDASDSTLAWDNRGYPDATGAAKGIASFGSPNFTVISGVVTISNNGINDAEIDWGTGSNQVSIIDVPATAWRTVFWNGSGVATELILGGSGQVLTSGGASANPTWETPSGGSSIWDEIGDAAAPGSVDFGEFNQELVGVGQGDNGQADFDTVLALNLNQIDDNGGVDEFVGFAINVVSESGDAGDILKAMIIVYEAGAANDIMDAAIHIDNEENATATMTDAILITSSGVNDGVTDAIDVSAANILNAINIGTNNIVTGAETILSTELDRLAPITGAIYYVGGTDVAITDGGTGANNLDAFILADGSNALTADWPAGAFDITGLKALDVDTIRNGGAAIEIVEPFNMNANTIADVNEIRLVTIRNNNASTDVTIGVTTAGADIVIEHPIATERWRFVNNRFSGAANSAVILDSLYAVSGSIDLISPLDLNSNHIVEVDSLDAGTGFFDRLYANPASGDRLLMPRVAASTPGHVLKVETSPSGYDSTYWAADNTGGAADTALVLAEITDGDQILKWAVDTLLVFDNAVGTQNLTIKSNADDRLIIRLDTIHISGDKIGDFAGASLVVASGVLNVDTASAVADAETKVVSANAIFDYGVANYQPLAAALTDLADLTITSNFINTANPWAANEITEADPTVDTESEIEAITGMSFGTKTTTAGFILVADGSEYDGVIMSGDGTMASGGALTITNDAIQESDLEITNAGSPGDVLSQGAGDDFTWIAPGGGGGNTFKLGMDSGDGTQGAFIFAEDTIIIQGSATVRVDTATGTGAPDTMFFYVGPESLDSTHIGDNAIGETEIDFGTGSQQLSLGDFTDDLGENPGHTHTTTSLSGILNVDIGAGAAIVYTKLLFSNNIDSADLGSNSIGESELDLGSGAQQVGIEDMVSSNTWSTVYWNATVPVTLDLGASGDVLTSGGVAAAPTWETPTGGSGNTFKVGVADVFAVQDSVNFQDNGDINFVLNLGADVDEITASYVVGSIVNADVNASAGIVYSKLTFNNDIDSLDLGTNSVGIVELDLGFANGQQIGIEDMDNSNDWSTLYWGASGLPVTVSLPTSGLVWKSNGVASAPTWQADATGGGVWVTKNTSDSVAAIGSDTLIIITRNSTTDATIVKVGESDGSLKILADTVGKAGGTTNIANELDLGTNNIIGVGQIDGEYGFILNLDTGYVTIQSSDTVLTIPGSARLVIKANSGDAMLHFQETTDGWNIRHRATDNDLVFSEVYNGSERLNISPTGAVTFNDAYTFPTSDGGTDEFLQTNGSGALVFTALQIDTFFFSMTIDDPDNLVKDTVMLLPIEAERFPSGITIISIGFKSWNTSTYSITFMEYTQPGNGGTESEIEVVATSTSTEAEDDGTLTDAAMAAGSIVVAELPATDVNEILLWFTFTVN